MPTPEQVVFSSNAGIADPSQPGLQGFLNAWNVFNDFIGGWQQQATTDVLSYGTAVNGIFGFGLDDDGPLGNLVGR